MNLPETGEVVTPLDDPCQYNPAWRSILACYLLSVGVRSRKDCESLSKSGCVTVTRTVTRTVTQDDGGAAEAKDGKNKKKPKKKPKEKKVTETVLRPISPFHESSEYRSLVIDKWIVAHLSMMEEEIEGNGLSDESVPFKLAARWYMEPDSEAAMKKRIEPMLLTEIGMDIITMDIAGMPSMQPAIEAYEKMYFNCRDDSFNLSPSMQLIERFAMPWGPIKSFLRKWEELDEDGFCIQDGRPIAKDSDIWRAIAATMGYEALIYLWRWENRAHGLKDKSLGHMIELSWKASVSKLMSDLYTGSIAHEDAARILSSYTAQMKFMSDDRREGGESDDTTSAMLALLYTAAPKMRELVQGGAGMITDSDIQNRIAAQQAIDKTNVQDAGRQVMDEVIDAQIEEAIEET